MINLDERRIQKKHEVIELTPKSFDVLQLLIERRGEKISKDEILGTVWAASFVEEANLPVQIFKIRKTLGESKTEPLIETIPGFGYRLIAPIEPSSIEEWKRLVAGGGVPEKRPNSLAVMRFSAQDTSRELEYMISGFRDALNNHICRHSIIRVTARQTVDQVSASNESIVEVADKLGVMYLITGNVIVSDDVISVNCEIIDCLEYRQVWGKTFKGDVSVLQTFEKELVHGVGGALVSHTSCRDSFGLDNYTTDFDSHRLFLKGCHFHELATAADLERGVNYFKQAISVDPTNTLAYVELIESYISMFCYDYLPYDATIAAIGTLMDLVTELGDRGDRYHTMLGGKAMYLDWDLQLAAKHLRVAIELNPKNLLARYRFTNYLVAVGFVGEALAQIREIKHIDPLSVQTLTRTGRLFFKICQYENAESYLSEALELSPDNYIALDLLAATRVVRGDCSQAMQLLRRSIEINFNLDTLSMLGYIYAISGDTLNAGLVIDELCSKSYGGCSVELKVARILLGLGETEAAFDKLEKAIEHRDVDVISLNQNPSWMKFVDHPRYRELLKRVFPTSPELVATK